MCVCVSSYPCFKGAPKEYTVKWKFNRNGNQTVTFKTDSNQNGIRKYFDQSIKAYNNREKKITNDRKKNHAHRRLRRRRRGERSKKKRTITKEPIIIRNRRTHPLTRTIKVITIAASRGTPIMMLCTHTHTLKHPSNVILAIDKTKPVENEVQSKIRHKFKFSSSYLRVLRYFCSFHLIFVLTVLA